MPKKKTSNSAKELSKLGASKGGKARANVLTPDERKEIARKAVRARWKKAGKLKQDNDISEADIVEMEESTGFGPTEGLLAGKPYSMFTGTVHLGGLELECHVLSDFRRVFTQREMVKTISGGRESGNLARYLERNPLTAGQTERWAAISFTVPPKYEAIGYEATALIDICDLYLEAEERGLLKPSQIKLARQASMVVRATAKVGIIALIDEATGYQEFRRKNELQVKLQAFIAEEMQEWARMFPDEFWVELARLESVRYSPRHRPLRWGKYVMMFVYDAIDPDIGKALREKNPNPRFLKNHHQWLKKFGRQKVNDQIQRVIAVMKLCSNMDEFRRKFDHVFKKVGLQLSFDDQIWTQDQKKH